MNKMRRLSLTLLAIAAVAMLSIQFTAEAGGGGNRHRVRAQLDGKSLASGQVDYRERTRNKTTEQRFSVEVEDATPGEIMMVHVNDLLLGIIVIDDFGIGELQYRTPAFIDDPGDGDPIPDGFPMILDGDIVTVGPLGGIFVER